MRDRLKDGKLLLWTTVGAIIFAGCIKYLQWFILRTPSGTLLQGLLNTIGILATTTAGVGIAVLVSDLVAAWLRPADRKSRGILIGIGATILILHLTLQTGAQLGVPFMANIGVALTSSLVLGELIPVVGSVLLGLGLLSSLAGGKAPLHDEQASAVEEE